jgi:hypothetical protein
VAVHSKVVLEGALARMTGTEGTSTVTVSLIQMKLPHWSETRNE